jgi:hypothetical protein
MTHFPALSPGAAGALKFFNSAAVNNTEAEVDSSALFAIGSAPAGSIA